MKRTIGICISRACLTAAVFAAVTAWPLAAQDQKTGSGTALQAEQPDRDGRVQAVFIAISPYEIFPAAIRVKPGPFRLEIRSSLGGALPELQIETPSRQIARSTAKRERFKSRDREIMELPVGERCVSSTLRHPAGEFTDFPRLFLGREEAVC